MMDKYDLLTIQIEKIENVFAKLKTFYRLVARLDKLECTFNGFLFFTNLKIFTVTKIVHLRS